MTKQETMLTDMREMLRTQMAVKGQASTMLTLACFYSVQIEQVVHKLAGAGSPPATIVHMLLMELMDIFAQSTDLSDDDAKEALQVASNLLNRVHSFN